MDLIGGLLGAGLGGWGREWGHWVSVLERSTRRRVQGENECGLEVWEEVLRVSVYVSAVLPIFQK